MSAAREAGAASAAGPGRVEDIAPVGDWVLLAHDFGEGAAALLQGMETSLARAGMDVRPVSLAHLDGDLDADSDPLQDAAEAVRSVAGVMAAEGNPPRFLVGHGVGGAAALVAASKLPTIAAVATISAPTDRRHRVRSAARALGRPLLVIRRPDSGDESADADRIFEAAAEPRSCISLPRPDETGETRAAHQAGAVIAAWLSGYGSPARGLDAAPAAPAEGEVVARTGRDHYRTEIFAGSHTVIADEPVSMDGADAGPSPYDLLLAALAACTSITLRMYADRKGWPLEKVIVGASHHRQHAADAAECPTRPARTDRVTRTVEVTGALNEEQRQRLLEIANRCPVHRTLAAGVITESVLVPPGSVARETRGS